MNKARCMIVRACSRLAGHPGVWVIGLAAGWMALAPRPAWGQWQTSGSNIYYNGGNVGIGTPSPAANLHIDAGSLRLSNSASTSSRIEFRGGSDGGYSSSIYMYDPSNRYRTFLLDGYYSYALTAYDPAGTQVVGISNNAAATNTFFLSNVGIGTTNPQYKLAVNGNIGAQDIIVTNTGWSDYVFRPGYRLRPLSEVSAFIQKHHHLPDIPTEADVKEKGVSLGDMQAKLLAKVEELTLHLIQQEKENKELRERLAQVENRVSANGGVASGLR